MRRATGGLAALAIAALWAAGCSRGETASTLGLEESGAADPYIGHLHWMAGAWISVDEDTIAEEHWTAPRGGMILGLARTTVGGRVTFWESMQIYEEDEQIVFQPWPKGEIGVPFYQVETGDQTVVFENENNDFPQRIEYTRRGDVLEAVLTGSTRGDSRRETWRWKLAGPSAR